jgi:hypothetical protein
LVAEWERTSGLGVCPDWEEDQGRGLGGVNTSGLGVCPDWEEDQGGVTGHQEGTASEVEGDISHVKEVLGRAEAILRRHDGHGDGDGTDESGGGGASGGGSSSSAGLGSPPGSAGQVSGSGKPAINSVSDPGPQNGTQGGEQNGRHGAPPHNNVSAKLPGVYGREGTDSLFASSGPIQYEGISSSAIRALTIHTNGQGVELDALLRSAGYHSRGDDG